MKTYKQWLSEKYEFEKHETGDDSFHAYSFKIPKRHEADKDSHGAVMIMHHPKDKGKATLHFATGDNRMDTTGEHKGRAAQILSTVHHVAKQHAAKHGVKEYEFSSDDKEKSRTKLYGKLVARHGGSEVPRNKGEKATTYRIPAH